MTQKIIELLEKYGPMLSGKAAHLLEKEYNLSNSAARQILSRAKVPVRKISALSFENRQKFLYLEEQYETPIYHENLLSAIRSSSHINWIYICAFYSQNGYVSKNILPALVSAPTENLKRHKLHSRVIADLQTCHIIEEYSETYWKLSDWAMGTHPANFNRAVGLEAVKKQIAHDFSKWAANINLIGYQTAKMLPDHAEFAHFQWGLTAPSYVTPLYKYSGEKPGFVIADIFFGQNATPEDAAFYLDKLATIRSFKNLPAFLPVFLVGHLEQETLQLLKENKVIVGIIENIFDKKYTTLLGEVVRIFTNASAIVSKKPEELKALFSEITRSDGRYNDMIGDMFELVVGYYYHCIGCQILEIRKKIQNPETRKKNEIDVFAIRDGRIYIVECKAMNSTVDIKFVDHWLSENIGRIREWLRMKYPQYENTTFQLWSLGGFTVDARDKLNKASRETKKYKIEFYDKKEILEMAKSRKVQPVVDILQHIHPPLEKINTGTK